LEIFNDSFMLRNRLFKSSALLILFGITRIDLLSPCSKPVNFSKRVFRGNFVYKSQGVVRVIKGCNLAVYFKDMSGEEPQNRLARI
jgi:hypothetical protein